MRRMLAVVVCAMLAVSAVGVWAQGTTQASGTDEWGRLIAANNLDLKGNTPFHLEMTFQLYDLEGKPTETGSFEEWWAAQGSEKTIVHLPGLDVDGDAPDGASPDAIRNQHLVSDLIEATVHPVQQELVNDLKVKDEARKFGKIQMSCVTAESNLKAEHLFKSATLCMDPQVDYVRALLEDDGHEVTIRESIGKFHTTYVAQALQIFFLGRNAITGKMTAMQGFDPTKSEVQLSSPAAPTDTASAGTAVGHVPAQVMDGKRVHFVEPEYPTVAKIAHLSGSVILGAVIGKDGALQNLVPIASNNSIFTEEAIRAVKQWKYSPYLLNGEPTEVDTTITVNFALGN